MLDTEEGALLFAAGRLADALAQPIRCHETEWGRRTQRALSTLKQVLDRHAIRVEAPTGLLGEWSDRSLLPFEGVARQAADLREQHEALGRAIALLETLLDAVLGLPELLSPLVPSGGSHQDDGNAGVFRGLLAVAAIGEQVLEAVRAHSDAERALQRATVPASRCWLHPELDAINAPDQN